MAERLFVTKINQSTSKEDLTTYFSHFGQTTDVYVPSVPGSANHKGIAFISFADPAAVQATMGHSPHEINGFEIVVDVASPKGEGKGGARAPVARHHAPAAAAGEASSDRLFVTKISPHVQKEDVREYFAQYGDLTDVYMPQAPGATTHKGICFVQFADPMSCQGVLLNGPHEIQGSPVVVDQAAGKGAPVPGKGGAKAFGGGAGKGAGYDAGYAAGLAAGSARGGGVKAGGSFKGAGAPKGGAGVQGRLFITHVNPEVTGQDLSSYFQQFGELSDVYVPTGKGIAFVSFSDPSCAAHVLQNPHHEVIPGQTVICDQAADKGAKAGGKGKGVTPY